MAIHNVTDSALLVKKSRKTIQRYIANGKLTVTRDPLGHPQIDTTELIRVFGALSQVSQKKVSRKSQNVTSDLSQQNNTITLTTDQLTMIIKNAVAEAIKEVVPLLIEHKQPAPIPEPITPAAPVEYKPRKVTPKRKSLVTKKKEPRNGYASALGLPNVITEVIHLKIMKLHQEGATSQEIGKEVSIALALVQRTINAST